MKKRLRVHALPTEKESNLFTNPTYGHLSHPWVFSTKMEKHLAHYIYFTSDDVIIEPCWAIQVHSKELFWVDKSIIGYGTIMGDKVVATNNPDLLWSKATEALPSLPNQLPIIPQSFIQYFVEKQGVWEVDVEIEAGDCLHPNECGKIICECPPKFKLNSQGEVIWHPVEQRMFSETEIRKALDNPFGSGSVNRDEYRTRVLAELGLK